jgi:hypothetical protein
VIETAAETENARIQATNHFEKCMPSDLSK